MGKYGTLAETATAHDIFVGQAVKSQAVDVIQGFPGAGQEPISTAVGLPAWSGYPMAWTKVMPWTHVGIMTGLTALAIYDQGETRYWLSPTAPYIDWVYHALFGLALLFTFLDVVVTCNGTYRAYKTNSGFESNSNIRRFVEVLEIGLGVNFAQGMVLHELLIYIPNLTATWYFGYKKRNQANLGWLGALCWQRFQGWRSWPDKDNLLDLSLFWEQMIGRKGQPFQGGGPAPAVGYY